MTPGARAAAAIELLDVIFTGEDAERTLTNWGRAHRYAGSSDRAAVRDLVFDALRCRRSFGALGGGKEDGRAVILGGLRAQGTAPETIFTGEGYAPAAPEPDEAQRRPSKIEEMDLPDWLLPYFEKNFGPQTATITQALRCRAPVFLRVNLRRTDLETARAALLADAIETVPHKLAATALEVTSGARGIRNAQAYKDGLVELQDAASQALIEALNLIDGMRVLDYCAGGGGKALAMAAQARIKLFAHDSDPRRMRDLPVRAKRAGVKITELENPAAHGVFDLVLADVPCSGAGSWRRDPQGKWRLDAPRLAELGALQADILTQAAPLVRSGGTLAYVTCSLLREENEERVEAFLAQDSRWKLEESRNYSLLDGADGFFLAILKRQKYADEASERS